MQGAWIQSLVRELYPHATTKDPTYCNEDPAQPKWKQKPVFPHPLGCCEEKWQERDISKRGKLCLRWREENICPSPKFSEKARQMNTRWASMITPNQLQGKLRRPQTGNCRNRSRENSTVVLDEDGPPVVGDVTYIFPAPMEHPA